MRSGSTWIFLAGLSVVLATALAPRFATAEVKNVILMISDGAGFNHWTAGSMYQGRWDAQRGRSTQVYDGDGWIEVACATYPLNLSETPLKTDVQTAELVYDPAKAWNGHSGYDWLKRTFTDSAAAGTALATGVRTYNSAINWNDLDRPISPTIPQIAKQNRKSVGVVTSVQWSHATPASLGGARVPKRSDYVEIANQMIQDGVLDVIMGAGHPDFDNDGQPVTKKKNYQFVGGQATWEAIEAARATPDGKIHGFRPVSTKAEFESLVSDETPEKVLGTAQVAKTLQYSRSSCEKMGLAPSGNGENPRESAVAKVPVPIFSQPRSGAAKGDSPYDDPLLTTVPSLAVMTRGALNVLDRNPEGLWLMVEGGAVDWAGHDNQGGRMVEEQIDFVEAVEAVVQWVEANSNWDETLLILTADHETGLIWGPESGKPWQPFQPIVDRGKGSLPLLRFHSDKHSNSLVPVYARGHGAQWLVELADRTDPVRGRYLDNTDVFYVMARAVSGRVAAPAAVER